MAGGGGGNAKPLEYTPTWIVATVCSVIVLISLVFERLLHRLGKRLKKSRKKKPLYEALLKVKEELMLLGFISLLLNVLQGSTGKICVKQSVMGHLLPCKLPRPHNDVAKTARYGAAGVLGGARRLLAGGGGVSEDYCLKKGKVPILSSEAIHQLHIFIFALAATHFISSATTILLEIAQTRNWRHWENKIQISNNDAPEMIKHVQEFKFIQDHFKGHRKRWRFFGWMRSFFKQFYGSVTKEDYTTMRLGFTMKHSRGNPKFNFYNYMIRALEVDCKKVVGISWYLWALLMIFLFLNVHGWHVYIWLSTVPFIMLLVVGSKMEHIITELAYEVAQKHTTIRGDLVVTPSDDFFWFHRPKLVLFLIHVILFQNAFEIAFFFYILATYGINSCIMGKQAYVIARVVTSVVSQLFCGYVILPLYAIVSQMGSSFKNYIFDDNITEELVNWAEKARRRTKNPINTTTSLRISPIDEARDGKVQMIHTQTNSFHEQGTVVTPRVSTLPRCATR